LRDEVTALARRLLPGRFLLLHVPRSRMPALYRCADLFLHMSQDEPSANAYIEALASGLAIVTHDRNVTRWTLEDTAVYANTSSIDDVVRAIHQAVHKRTPADVARRRDIVHRRFSWSQIAHEYAAFFRQVCGVMASRPAVQRMEVAR
jgi:glycosyltransferase involved in cell wall biosynthesis